MAIGPYNPFQNGVPGQGGSWTDLFGGTGHSPEDPAPIIQSPTVAGTAGAAAGIPNPANMIPGTGGGAGLGVGMFQSFIDNAGLTPNNAIKSLKKIGGMADEMGGKMEGVNDSIDASGNLFSAHAGDATNAYNQGIASNTGKYVKGQQNLKDQATDSANQLKGLYGQTDKSMQTLQGRADKNAGQSMSLKDAGNVNNSVQQGVRGLYNKEAASREGAYNREGEFQRDAYNREGDFARSNYNKEGSKQQRLYEQQAQGVGRQGLADTGVLAALGSQAMAGQLGGASPFTGGQLQAMQGANMNQAGQAYARAQQQMQGLRDQGMNRNMDMRQQGIGTQTQMRGQGLDRKSDLRTQGENVVTQTRNQGMQQGFDQSGIQYGRGQDAQMMASGMAQDRFGMGNAYQGARQGIRDEQSGYQGNIYGARQGASAQTYNNNMNRAGLDYGIAQDAGARDMAQINAQYSPKMAAQGQMANVYGQYGTGMMGMFGDIAKAIGGSVPLGGGTGG